jgi:5-oxoprolinase (ATP-hydrolysing) subunit A
MPLITTANLACGFHAGDPLTIMKTVAMAKEAGVSIGAHLACRIVWALAVV